MSGTIPSEEDLVLALRSLKAAHPALGIAKTQTLLLDHHKDWSVSEKRIRKILQSEGLHTASPNETKKVWPSSKVNDSLDVAHFSKKIEVRVFDKAKGKGLVTKEDIAKDDVIWKEDPFIIAPEWDIYDFQGAGKHCGYCTTQLALDSSLVIICPSSTSETPCNIRYCNRLCLKRSRATHPLLCAAQNPASIPLLQFIRRVEWQALLALTNLTSRILLANQLQVDNELNNDWGVVKGLAALGMEDRFKDAGREPDRDTWKKCFELYTGALHTPKSPADQKKLAKVLKKPLDPEIENALFEYSSFLRGLGRMSLNLESHGGLYALHSHLNHGCTPNISVRHLDQRTALSRITMIALTPIPAGSELLITYVNPGLGVRARRTQLMEWGFGECRCARCVEEAKQVKANGGDDDTITGSGPEDGGDELQKELTAALGVL